MTDASTPDPAVTSALTERLPVGRELPEPLARALRTMDERGWSVEGADGSPFLTPYAGSSVLGPVFSAGLSTRGWLNPDAPGAERLLPIAEVDGSGGLALIWFDDAGAARFVLLGSEGEGPLRLADSAIDFLRLVAIGFRELLEWNLGGEEPDEDEDGESVEALTEFRSWVEAEFAVEVPQTWNAAPDAAFEAWLAPLAEAHGFG